MKANRTSSGMCLPILRLLLVLSCTVGPGVAISANADGPVSTLDGIAAGGHDVVAYQALASHGKPVVGDSRYNTTFKGATWHFANKEDRDRFVQNPKGYAPAFNGHCANALSLGEGLIRTNGKHWLILDKQLYFFYAARGAHRWLDGDYKRYRLEATSAWEKLTSK